MYIVLGGGLCFGGAIYYMTLIKIFKDTYGLEWKLGIGPKLVCGAAALSIFFSLLTIVHSCKQRKRSTNHEALEMARH